LLDDIGDLPIPECVEIGDNFSEEPIEETEDHD
jgi:hypothetical protein